MVGAWGTFGRGWGFLCACVRAPSGEAAADRRRWQAPQVAGEVYDEGGGLARWGLVVEQALIGLQLRRNRDQ